MVWQQCQRVQDKRYTTCCPTNSGLEPRTFGKQATDWGCHAVLYTDKVDHGRWRKLSTRGSSVLRDRSCLKHSLDCTPTSNRLMISPYSSGAQQERRIVLKRDSAGTSKKGRTGLPTVWTQGDRLEQKNVFWCRYMNHT